MSGYVLKKAKKENLIALAKSGNIKALEELIRRVQKDIFAIFSHLTNNRQDIPDLTQEALLKMARSLPQLKDTKHFKPWLNRIITNVYYDYTRRNKYKTSSIDEAQLNEIRDKLNCEPGEKCIFSEIEELIKAALFTIPQSYRIMLILREFEGLSYNDISRITNTSLGTVKSRIARARIKIQNELRDFINI